MLMILTDQYDYDIEEVNGKYKVIAYDLGSNGALVLSTKIVDDWKKAIKGKIRFRKGGFELQDKRKRWIDER